MSGCVRPSASVRWTAPGKSRTSISQCLTQTIYEGVVEGNTLTFEGPARFQYQLDQDGKIDVNDDGAITTKWWLRNNSGEWEEWMTNINKKVS